MIGIISQNPAFHQALSRALSALGYREIFLLQPDLSTLLETQIPHASLLVLDAHLAFSASSWADRLRAYYGGAILCLAFASRPVARTWPGGAHIDTPGCTFGQLPLSLAELRCLLDAVAPPTPAEWVYVSRVSRCKALADRAAKLGHDYENALWQVLAALRELAKLSGSLAPDFQKVKHEIGIIHGRLTEERLSNFSTALTTLHAEADRLGLIDETCAQDKLDAYIAQVRQWLALLNLEERAVQFGDIFRAAYESRLALRELFIFFRVIKEKATKEVKGVSQNPLCR
jgi:hypothetical protein